MAFLSKNQRERVCNARERNKRFVAFPLLLGKACARAPEVLMVSVWQLVFL